MKAQPAHRSFTGFDQHAIKKRKDFLKQKNKTRLGKWLRLFFLILTVLFVLKTISLVPGFINSLRKPFPTAKSDFLNRGALDFTSRTNILLAGLKDGNLEEVGIASVAKKEKGVTVLILDPNAVVFTSSEAKTFRQIVSSESSPDFNLLAAELTDTLGLSVDGYLITTNSIRWVNEMSILKIIDNFFTFDFFTGLWGTKNYLNDSLETNLTSGDLLSLASFAKGIKADNLKFFDFTGAKTAEGFLDVELIERRLGISLLDNAISEEGATVEVVNASNVAGVEYLFKKILTKLGANVLLVSETPPTEKSIIYATEENKLVTKAKNILQCQVKGLPKQNGSVDMKIIIGEDYAHYFDF